jgi:hypothetical protein
MCLSTHKVRLIPWQANYSQLINEFNHIQLTKGALRQIEKFIRFDAFICKNKEAELTAAQSLLTLWSKLLQLLNKWFLSSIHSAKLHAANSHTNSNNIHRPNRHSVSQSEDSTCDSDSSDDSSNAKSHHHSRVRRPSNSSTKAEIIREKDLKLIFELIDCILNRHEFDLVHLIPSNSGNNSNSARQSVTKANHGKSSSFSAAPSRPSTVNTANHISSGLPSARSAAPLPNSQHSSFLSVHETLVLIQNYRKLLQTTVINMLNMVKHSEECDKFIENINLQREATQNSNTNSNFTVNPNNSAELHYIPLSTTKPTILTRCDFVWFCGRLLSIAFFRLPILSGPLLDFMAPSNIPENLAISPKNGPEPAPNSPIPLIRPELSTLNSALVQHNVEASKTVKSQENWQKSMLKSVDKYLNSSRQSVLRRLSLQNDKLQPNPSNLAVLAANSNSNVHRTSAAVGTNTVPELKAEANNGQISNAGNNNPATPVSPTEQASSNALVNNQVITDTATAATPTNSTTPARSNPDNASKAANSPEFTSIRQDFAALARNLTASFLSANPSLFEWTRPDLNNENSPSHSSNLYLTPQLSIHSSAESSNLNANSTDLTLQLLSAVNLTTMRHLLSFSHIFFIFSCGWLNHINRFSNPIKLPHAKLAFPRPPPPIKQPNSSKHRQNQQGEMRSTAGASFLQNNNSANQPNNEQVSAENRVDGILWDVVPGYWPLLVAIMRRLILLPVEIEPNAEEIDQTTGDEQNSAKVSLLQHRNEEIEANPPKNELETELSLRFLRSEAMNDVRNLILRNEDCREYCLAWFIELILRHTPLLDKRKVETTLDCVDNWLNNYTQDYYQVQKAQWGHKTFETEFSQLKFPYLALKTQFSGPELPNLANSLVIPWLSSPSSPLFYLQQLERYYYSFELAKFCYHNGTMNSVLPPNFNFPVVLKAFSLLLRQEQFQVLLKTLTFLYMHLGHFYGEQRIILLDQLILNKQLFPRLFLHWCAEIRRLFYYILLYRVMRDGRGVETIPGPPTNISSPKTINVLIDGREEKVPVLSLENNNNNNNNIGSNNASNTVEKIGHNAGNGAAKPVRRSSDSDSHSNNAQHDPDHSSSWLSRMGTTLLSLVESTAQQQENFSSPVDAAESNPSELTVEEWSEADFDLPRRNRSNSRTTAAKHVPSNISAQQHELDDASPLKIADPTLDSCSLAYTKFNDKEYETENSCAKKLNDCLAALHEQYYLDKTDDNSVVEYDSSLHVYSFDAFREFRRYFASFRRVQSQLSPSLQLSGKIAYTALLPSNRAFAAGVEPIIYSHQASEYENTDLALLPFNSHHYEGVVLIPQLYYNIP